MDHFDTPDTHTQWRCAVCKEIRNSELDLLDDLQGVLTLTKSSANIFEEYRNNFLVLFNPTEEEFAKKDGN